MATEVKEGAQEITNINLKSILDKALFCNYGGESDNFSANAMDSLSHNGEATATLLKKR